MGVPVNLVLKERKLIMQWFDIAVECVTLSDQDLKLYDKIRESVEDEEDLNDPLVYNPRKRIDDDDVSSEDDDFYYDLDDYSDDD